MRKLQLQDHYPLAFEITVDSFHPKPVAASQLDRDKIMKALGYGTNRETFLREFNKHMDLVILETWE
jgi:hypothetical protein